MNYQVIAILTFILHVKSQELQLKYLHNDPVLLLKKSECRLQTGSIKIVHPINVTTLETNALLLCKIARQLDNKLPITQLVVEKSRILMNNLRQIKPINPRRHRRWDTLGTAWKWLAGTPDAEDLRLINTTTNKLIQQNNKQLQINKIINERIEDMTSAINNLIEHQNLENKILLEEYDAITLLLYIDTLNKILEEIQDTVLKTKIHLPNNKLLTLKEILMIESLLTEQGIQTQFPEEALNFITPKIAIKQDTLLYILQIPQLQNFSSETIQIFPLIVNEQVLIDIPPLIIKSKNKWYETTKPEDFIQYESHLKILEKECIHSILSGIKSQCNVTKVTKTFINLVADNKILVNNAQNISLVSDCGPHDRFLSGNYLITFNNCTVTTLGEKFISKEIVNAPSEKIGAFPELVIKKNLIEHHDITIINNNTMLNRETMNSISFKQFTHRNWIFGTFGGLSATTVSIIGITIFVCTRKRKLVIKIRHRKSPKLAEDVQS